MATYYHFFRAGGNFLVLIIVLVVFFMGEVCGSGGRRIVEGWRSRDDRGGVESGREGKVKGRKVEEIGEGWRG